MVEVLAQRDRCASAVHWLDSCSSRRHFRRGTAMPQRPRLGTVFWASLCLAGAAVSALYLIARAFSIAFAPFALVDWLARVTPGRTITFFIDAMVSSLRIFSIANLSSAAKTSEAAFGVVAIIVGLTIVGAVMLEMSPRRFASLSTVGATVGVVAGGLASALVYASRSARGALDGTITVILFAMWGFMTDWTRNRIWTVEREQAAATDRRRFLIALTGTCAAIVLGGVGAVISTLRRSRPTASASALWSATNTLPNHTATVMPVTGTRPELTSLED